MNLQSQTGQHKAGCDRDISVDDVRFGDDRGAALKEDGHEPDMRSTCSHEVTWLCFLMKLGTDRQFPGMNSSGRQGRLWQVGVCRVYNYSVVLDHPEDVCPREEGMGTCFCHNTVHQIADKNAAGSGAKKEEACEERGVHCTPT